MKIGIIGSGIAGLASAYQLHKSKHEVSVFEKSSQLGMDFHRFSVGDAEQPDYGDLPSRMFNPRLWPNLVQLYEELGVEFKEVNPTQSFSFRGEKSWLTLDSAHQPWQWVKTLVNQRLRNIVREATRLRNQGASDLKSCDLSQMTLDNYLKKNHYPTPFIEDFLYPTLSSTVFTCSFDSVANYPAEMALYALQQLSESQSLMRTKLGTKDVVTRLAKGPIDLQLGQEVQSVVNLGDGAEVVLKDGTQKFDHVIIATQANHVLPLLPDPTEEEANLFDSIRYEDVRVTVHTDPALMPNDQKNWSTFNMVMVPEGRQAMCTIWLNSFHDQWTIDRPIFQTINPIIPADPATVLSDVILQRPVVDLRSRQSWQALHKLHQQSHRRLWFVGSYASPGVPLLESGVNSSMQVVARINGEVNRTPDLSTPMQG